jgi:hypothetical protein
MVKYLLLMLVLLTGCGARYDATDSTYSSAPGAGYLQLPAHLDTSQVNNPNLVKIIDEAAFQWYLATDGIDFLDRTQGQTIPVVIKDLDPGIVGQANVTEVPGNFHMWLDFNIIPAYPDQGASDYAETAVMHEMGHLLGLQHSSTGIMQPYVTPPPCIDKEALDLVCKRYQCGPLNKTTCN